MKKVELSEEKIYIWECPYCEEISEERDCVLFGEIVTCEHCGKDCKVA